MTYRFGDCELDTQRYELRVDGVRKHVEPQVFDVLAYLIAHRERVVTREELLAQVWGHSFVSEATLSSRLMAARKAIGDSGRAQALIRTVRGRGYQFVEAVEEVAAVPAMATAPMQAGKETTKAIGRQDELAHLSRLFDRAVDGARQFALVTGDAGVGKTTLVQHFVEQARSTAPLLVVNGRCPERRRAGEPYMPLLEALDRACVGPEGEQVVSTLSRVAPTWMSQIPGPLDAEELEAVIQRSVGARPERMLREMAGAIEALSRVTPVLLVLDDLHWADVSTLDLLTHVARQDDPSRLMIIGTARTITGGLLEEVRRELRPRGKCSELAVPLLGPDDVHAFLEDRYSGAESLASVVHRRTNGNPLFMECLLRSWRDGGALEMEGDLWCVQRDPRELAREVPETLRGLLEQDLERLAAEEQRVLEVASTTGADFSAAAVAAGLHLEVEEVESRCAELARDGRFLRERGAAEWPDGTVAAAFTFVHDLHRQVLYERIPSGRRVRLHRDIAARLEAAYGPEATGRAAELAAHYVEGGEPEPAIRYLQLAAEQALARGAHRDAVRDLTAALELVGRTPGLPDRERRELSLQAALSSALVATAGWSSAEAEHAYDRALELARAVGDDHFVALLLYELAGLHEYRGDYRGSEALLYEALRVEGAERDEVRLLEAHELMACSLFHQGSFDAAVDHADRGLALRRPEQLHPGLAFHGEDPAASCNDWAGLALWCLGYPDQALERIAAALRLAGEAGREYALANARMHAARLHQLRREPDDALVHAEATVALADERGFAYQAAAGTILLGWALAAAGNSEEGVDRMREGLAAHCATGARMDRPYFLALLAEGCLVGGCPDAGLPAIDEALEEVVGDRDFFYEAELHRLQGALTLGSQESNGPDNALMSFRRALEVARRQQARSLELRAAFSLAELLQERGDVDEALEALSAPADWFGEGSQTGELREARALIGRLRAQAPRTAR